VGDARKKMRDSEEAARATKTAGARRERKVSSEEAARVSGWLSWLSVCVFGNERCMTGYNPRRVVWVGMARVRQGSIHKTAQAQGNTEATRYL
jgi:hypothetical protein